MIVEFYCSPNDMESVSLTVDVEALIKASTPSAVELIFTFC